MSTNLFELIAAQIWVHIVLQQLPLHFESTIETKSLRSLLDTNED
jgi:hypothetical protein